MNKTINNIISEFDYYEHGLLRPKHNKKIIDICRTNNADNDITRMDKICKKKSDTTYTATNSTNNIKIKNITRNKNISHIAYSLSVDIFLAIMIILAVYFIFGEYSNK